VKTIRDFPAFPPMARLPHGNIPKEVLQYLLDTSRWKNQFVADLREVVNTYHPSRGEVRLAKMLLGEQGDE